MSTKPEYFDIHSHLHFPQYNDDKEEVVCRLENEKVFTVNVGTDFESSKKALELAKQSQNLFASIGLHPDDNKKEEFSVEDFNTLVSHPKVVSIGECGLDYFRLEGDGESQKKRQKKEFEKQIEFAIEHNKPLMLHIRDAYEDSLDILESYKKKYGDKLRGDSHFFAGDLDIAKRFLDLNFYLSFTGVITFARDYDEVIKYAPIESIMSETDAPYVAPVPFRGKRNEPTYVKEVVEMIARIRKEDLQETKDILVKNALKFFKIF